MEYKDNEKCIVKFCGWKFPRKGFSVEIQEKYRECCFEDKNFPKVIYLQSQWI